MVGLAILELIGNFYITYKGHFMGANIEFDMRNEIFEHYQKLSFNFYDNKKIGQLMSIDIETHIKDSIRYSASVLIL